MAEPSRTPPFLLKHHGVRTKVIRTATASSVHPLDTVARVTISLRASLYGLLASTRSRLTMNLATNQRAQRRDRTNVCMCHLDHLLSVAVGSTSTHAAHRSRASPMPRMIQIAAGIQKFKSGVIA